MKVVALFTNHLSPLFQCIPVFHGSLRNFVATGISTVECFWQTIFSLQGGKQVSLVILVVDEDLLFNL